MLRRLAIFMIFSLGCAVSLLAQNATSTALNQMVDQEKKFAQVCAEKGIRDSFLDFFAEDVVTFGSNLRFSKEYLRQRASKDPLRFKLYWLPVYGDISKANDLGYLTGPSLLEDSKKEQDPWRGQYLSVWRKEQGDWKVAVDFGVDAPTAIFKADAGFDRAPQPGKLKLVSAAADSLTQAESRFNDKAQKDNSVVAACDVAFESLRLYRDNETPLENKQSICSLQGGEKRQYKSLRQQVSSSNDLGYAIGEFTNGSESKPSGAYLHIWKWDGQRWTLVMIAEKKMAS